MRRDSRYEKGGCYDMKTKEKPKKKLIKKEDGSWDTTDLYKSGKNPFSIEYLKFYNQMEGRDQILFLYKDRKTKRVCKYRILR